VKEGLMSRPDEGLIHMWLDGECSADEAAEIERLVATDPAWAAAVAEARGLIAASSRIVSALDAVPAGVMPAGSKAAPGAEKIAPASPELPARNGFRVRPWMKMAAGLVLVVGTAYAVRDQTREVFTAPPVEAPEAPQRVARTTPVVAAPEPSVASGKEQAAVPAPAPPPPAAGASVASVAERDASATTNVSPSASPSPAAFADAVARTPTDSARARRFAELQRRSEKSPLSVVITTGTRGAEPERILDSPNSVSMVSSERLVLECWQVTSPDSLRTLLRSTEFRPGQLDSLLVEIPVGSRRYYSLFRSGDTLRGPVTAKRVACPKP
jgi:anti-sigma factor RsiW